MKKMKEYLAEKENILDLNLYQTYLKDLYLNINCRRDFTDIYGYLHRNVGDLGKSLESGISDQSKFILLISWLFSLANKLDINVLESLIKKFPGICPYCLESQCVCYRTNKKPLKTQTAYEIEMIIYYKWIEVSKGIKAFNFDSAVKFITKIYPFNEVIWKNSGYHSHLLKIHQEMTEVHEAYSNFKDGKKPINAVMDEIADVFAWVLSAWEIKYPNESMETAFDDYYINDCPVCRSAPCKCELGDSRPSTLPDFGKLMQIKNALDQLVLLIPGNKNDFSALLEQFNKVIETQNMPMVWAILRETKVYLDRFNRIATTLDLEVKSALLLSTTLSNLNKILKGEGGHYYEEDCYDVFLSYSKTDKDQVREIFDFLESEKINVFMSERRIEPSYDWEEVTKEALKNSFLLCVVASPESLISEWVKTESSAAWILDIPILPILLHCNVGDLPEILRKKQSIDFHEYRKIIPLLKKIKSALIKI